MVRNVCPVHSYYVYGQYLLSHCPESHERLLDVYERLDEMDADNAETKAGYILSGLGFTKEMQHTKVAILVQNSIGAVE